MNIKMENLFFFNLETASVPLLDLGFAISASSQHAMKVFNLMKESIGRIIERYKTSNIRYALLTFGDFANRHVNFTSDPPSSEALKKVYREYQTTVRRAESEGSSRGSQNDV